MAKSPESLRQIKFNKSLPLATRQRFATQEFISQLRCLSQKNNVLQTKISADDVLKNRSNVTNFIPGQMYMWLYDPKHKDTLPYYDTAPLVLLLDIYDDGFLGLNLHYVPYEIRIKFIEHLMSTITAKRWGTKTAAQFTYANLKAFSQIPEMKACIKRYLFSHMRSKVVRILPDNWETISYLPIERFVKKTKQSVWRESKRIGRTR